MGGGPLGAKYRSGEGLPSEEEAQETETPMFRCLSQTLGNYLRSLPHFNQSAPVLRTHCLSVTVLGEGAVQPNCWM